MKDRACEIAINPKYDGYKKRLSSMVYKFFDKKIGPASLAQELPKQVIKNFKKRTVQFEV